MCAGYTFEGDGLMERERASLFRGNVLVPFLILIMASLLLVGCGGDGAGTGSEEGQPAPAEVAPAEEAAGSEAAAPAESAAASAGGIDGQALFMDRCTKCHGLNGFGDGPSVGSLRTQGGMNLTILQERTDEELFLTISGGKGTEMPPWGIILSVEEREALVQYIKALGDQ